MTTADQVDPGRRVWVVTAPGTVAEGTQYPGRHRNPAGRGFSLRRLFYVARHRRR